jgi:hypothetical protein
LLFDRFGEEFAASIWITARRTKPFGLCSTPWPHIEATGIVVFNALIKKDKSTGATNEFKKI